MNDQPAMKALSAKFAARLAGALAICVGGLVLVGWTLDITALKSSLTCWVSEKPNTALAFVLTGIAQLFSAQRSSWPARLARFCGLLAGLIGLLTLMEYVCVWNPGFDQWLFRDPAGTVGASPPGRMVPDAASCFVLLAAGMEIAHIAHKRKQMLITTALLGTLVTVVALAAILTYLTQGFGAFGWLGLRNMELPTAVVFAVLGLTMAVGGWQLNRSLWFLGGRQTTTLGIGLVLLMCIGLYSSRSVVRLSNNIEQITHTEHKMHQAVAILAEAIDAQTHTRGYIITDDERHLKAQRAAATQCRAALAEFRQSIVAPVEQARNAGIEAQVNEVLRWFSQIIEAHRTGVAAAVQRDTVNHGEDLMDRLHKLVNPVVQEERSMLQEGELRSENLLWFTHLIIVAGTLVSLSIFLFALLGLNHVMAEQNRTAQALKQEQTLMLALMQNVPAYIYFKDTASRFLRINPFLAKFFGVSDPAQVVGKTDADFLPAERARKALADEQEILRTGQPVVDIEEKTIRPTGSVSWELTTKLPLRDGLGQIVGTCGISSDITARKRAEEALERSARQLQEQNAEMEQFLYTASHDLKSPLVTVRTFLGYLEQDLPTADAGRIEKDLGFIRAAANKMARLLDELLEMSRIGRVVSPPVKVTVGTLVDDALDAVAGRISGRGVQVQVADRDVTLYGDRGRLGEVWQNLVDNACKFMGQQQAPRIEIGVEQRETETVFFVRDNGIGIDPRHRSKVFGLFEKLNPRAEGTGIGLAYVKRIVEFHEGRIWVESEGVGQGTCFYFTLPRAVDKSNEGEKL